MVNDVYKVSVGVCEGCERFTEWTSENPLGKRTSGTNGNGNRFTHFGCGTAPYNISASVPSWCDRINAHMAMRKLKEL